jgi:alpha-beta hydrolase superfamily lysophospholipase
LDRAGSLQSPVLLLCGGADRIISVKTSQQWFDRLRGEKRSVLFPDCYHELHHEPVRDEVLRLIREWTFADD